MARDISGSNTRDVGGSTISQKREYYLSNTNFNIFARLTTNILTKGPRDEATEAPNNEKPKKIQFQSYLQPVTGTVFFVHA